MKRSLVTSLTARVVSGVLVASIIAACSGCLTPNEMIMPMSKFRFYNAYKTLVHPDARHSWSTPGGKIEALEPTLLNEISLNETCFAYANLDQWLTPVARQQLRDSMVSKGFLPNEFQLIDEKNIRIGMTKECLYSIMGLPSSENRRVSESGVSIQHVYGEPPYSQYYYTEDGILTSWSD